MGIKTSNTGKAYDIILTGKKGYQITSIFSDASVKNMVGEDLQGKDAAASCPLCAGHSAIRFLQDYLIKLPKHYTGKHHYTHFTDEETEAERS